MKAPDSDVPRISSIFKRLMEVKGENKNSGDISPTLTMPVKQTDPYRTSETYSGMAPANFSITDSKEQNNSKEGKTRFPKSKDSLWIFLYIERGSAQSS